MSEKGLQCYTVTSSAAVFENTYSTYFSDLKKHDFLRVFEIAYQIVAIDVILSFV